MAEIAQGYVHLKPFGLQSEAKKAGRSILDELSEAAREIYSFPVEIDVEIEDGSIKVWATVIVTLYSAISVYPQFKDGLKELKSDAVHFGTKTIDVVEKFMNPAQSQIFRVERRTKVSGKLYRLSRRAERLEENYNSLSPEVRESESAAIQSEIDKLVNLLDEAEAYFIKNNIKVPGKTRKVRPETRKVALRPEQLEFSDQNLPSILDHPKRLLYKDRKLVMPKGLSKRDAPKNPSNPLIE